MENIQNWINKFKENWINHNIKEIIGLFDKNLVYFENPYKKITSLEILEKEWENIKNQKNIKLNLEIFSKNENKYTIIWYLEYQDKENKLNKFAGTYLIKLNKENLCNYFFHTCENY